MEEFWNEKEIMYIKIGEKGKECKRRKRIMSMGFGRVGIIVLGKKYFRE